MQTRPAKEPARVPESSVPSAPVDSIDDLRLQVRELTSANQDLRKKLAEQTAEMEALKETLTRIQQDLDRAKPKAGSRRKSPPP
jgi:predicted RNase H-like nuclease (RuvC/YqgF family)